MGFICDMSAINTNYQNAANRYAKRKKDIVKKLEQ
jgi:hypothetical protein